MENGYMKNIENNEVLEQCAGGSGDNPFDVFDKTKFKMHDKVKITKFDITGEITAIRIDPDATWYSLWFGGTKYTVLEQELERVE